MRISLSSIHYKSQFRPPGYYDQVLAAGQVAGEELEISPSAWQSLKAQFSIYDEKPQLQLDLSNYSTVMERWTGSGFAIVSGPAYHIRHVACQACEHYKANAVIGCCELFGCEWLRFFLAPQRCPIGRWG